MRHLALDRCVANVGRDINLAIRRASTCEGPGKPEDMSDEDWADTVSRNVEHLEIMVAKDFWTTEDMTAANAAIAANS